MNDDQFQDLIRRSLGPAPAQPLDRDLWPEMVRRLDRRPAAVVWWDWALAAGVLASFAIWPHLIPALLYHL
jgi:hypothetical protein